jgi:hypothetical protein
LLLHDRLSLPYTGFKPGNPLRLGGFEDGQQSIKDCEPMPENQPTEESLDQSRLDAVQCPFCDQVTMPNLLADASVICSCPAERALPLDLVRGTPWDGMKSTMPMPADDPSFVGGLPEHRMPDGTEQSMPTEGRGNKRLGPLAGDHGQFGRDVTTENYPTLNGEQKD